MVDDSVRLGIDATPAEAGARRFTAALSSINAGVMNLGRRSAGAFRSLAANISTGTVGFNQFKAAQQGLNFNSTNRGILNLAGGFRGLENAMSATFQVASVLRVALGALTVGTLVRDVYDATRALQQFTTTMQAATGNMFETGEALRFTQGLALDLGQNLQVVQREYSQLAVAADISGMSSENTAKIFGSVSTAMAVMGRSSQDAQLSFLALQQMISKGTVMSEELRRQLGERMPGAVQMMAEAVGVSTAELAKMMKAGEVISSEVLPKFADIVQERFGPLMEQAFKRADVQIGRLGSTITMIQQQVGQAGFMDSLAEAASRLVDILNSPEFTDIADRLGLGLADATAMAADAVIFLVENMDNLIRVGTLFLTLGLAAAVTRIAQAFLFMAANAVRSAIVSVVQLISSIGVLNRSLAVTSGGLMGVSRGAIVAGASMRALSAVGSVVFGPVGLAIAAASLALMIFNDDLDDTGEAIAFNTRLLEDYAGSTEEAAQAVSLLSKTQLELRRSQAAETLENLNASIKEMTADITDLTAGGAFASLRAFSEVFSMLDTTGARAAFQISRLRQQFEDDGDVTSFLTGLRGINAESPGARQLVDHYVALAEALEKAGATAEQIQSALRNLTFEGFQRQGADDPFLKQLETLENAAVNLGDATGEATRMIKEMQQEVRVAGLSEFEQELVGVQEETSGLKDRLAELIGTLERAQARGLITEDQIDIMEQARVKLAQIEEWEQKVAAVRVGEKVAKEMEKLKDAAQKVLDRLFPLRAAAREFQEEMGLLNKVLGPGGVAENAQLLAEAQEKLRNEYSASATPVTAFITELEKENTVLKRTLDIMAQLPDATFDQANALAEAETHGRNFTAAELERANALQRTNELMAQVGEKPDPLGLRRMVDEDIPNLRVALADLEVVIAENLIDAVAEFATTGKLNIADLANTILLEMNKVAASQVFKQIFGMLAGQFGGAGAFGEGGGSFIADALSGVASMFGAAAFSEGGISHQPRKMVAAPASAFVGAPHFDKGGLTGGGIPAILHPNEAVVPLSGGRAIPVDIRNGGGSNGMNIVNQFNFPPGTDVNEFRRSQGQVGADVSQAMRRAARRNN